MPDTLATVPLEPPAAGPDRAFAPPPPCRGPPNGGALCPAVAEAVALLDAVLDVPFVALQPATAAVTHTTAAAPTNSRPALPRPTPPDVGSVLASGEFADSWTFI
ncbi:hypothetical protein [Streptacidiphilus sp. MAP12-20]|uniref:hypothetical protein n=1 Tax=Streptacidiphilus sp. MAP12-20 TaxID=3156299 RepID=UPI003516FFA1